MKYRVTVTDEEGILQDAFLTKDLKEEGTFSATMKSVLDDAAQLADLGMTEWDEYEADEEPESPFVSEGDKRAEDYRDD